VKKVEKVEIN